MINFHNLSAPMPGCLKEIISHIHQQWTHSFVRQVWKEVFISVILKNVEKITPNSVFLFTQVFFLPFFFLTIKTITIFLDVQEKKINSEMYDFCCWNTGLYLYSTPPFHQTFQFSMLVIWTAGHLLPHTLYLLLLHKSFLEAPLAFSSAHQYLCACPDALPPRLPSTYTHIQRF